MSSKKSIMNNCVFIYQKQQLNIVGIEKLCVILNAISWVDSLEGCPVINIIILAPD